MLEVEFKASYPSLQKCPKGTLPEYAFIGRSNVGKSSLINYLADKKRLARTSATPGKTQLLNFYQVQNDWFLVDLPGYGFAKVNVKVKKKWRALIEQYLLRRTHLMCAFLLIDSTLPAQKIDIEFMNWMGRNRIPFAIVFTKVDRIKGESAENKIEALKADFLEHWETLPTCFEASAVKQWGRDEILAFIEKCNANTTA